MGVVGRARRVLPKVVLYLLCRQHMALFGEAGKFRPRRPIMKKNIAFLLATSLVATIAVGCDGTGYVEDVTEEDCPSGLVLRVSDGQCVIPMDTIDDSASDMTEEDVIEDTTPTDPCADWWYLDGTEWQCGIPGGGDRIRIDLRTSEDECLMDGIIIKYEERGFTRSLDKVFFVPPSPAPPSSFTIENSPFNGECTLLTDE